MGVLINYLQYYNFTTFLAFSTGLQGMRLELSAVSMATDYRTRYFIRPNKYQVFTERVRGQPPKPLRVILNCE